MAKKRDTKRIIFAGAGIGVLIAVIVPVMLFVFGEDQITTRTVEDIIQENVDQGALEIPFVCASIEECNELGIDVSEPIEQNPISEIIDPIPEEIVVEFECIEPEVLVDGACIIPEEPVAEPPSLQIISTTTKIDNTGERFQSKTNFNIPLLAFFVEDTSNRDFDQGFIEQSLKIKTDPDTMVIGTGTFNVLIGNNSIFTSPIQIDFTGVTDQNGELSIPFISPIGTSSQLFTFSFRDFVDEFSSSGITQLRFLIQDVTVSIEENDYRLESKEILLFEIARDPNRVIIENEQGERLRIFPTDDNVKLCAWNGKKVSKNCIQRSFRFGCQLSRTVSSPNPSPTIGDWKFSKLNEQTEKFELLESGASFGGTITSVCPLDTVIQRDQVFKLEISNPNGDTITWRTDPEQRNFNFGCTGFKSTPTSTKEESCNYDAVKNKLLPP